MFRDLFYNFESSNGAYIRVEDSDKGARKLEIDYEGGGTIDLPYRASEGQAGDAFTVIPITFKWDIGKKVVRSQVEIKDGIIKMSGGTQDVFSINFVSSQTMNSRQNALKYSELSKRNKTGPVVDALKEVFPEVTDLSLEAVAGDLMLHVSMAGLPERIPLVVLSGGMNKYLSIVLAILATAGGTVIVDEIENGFYYENLPSLLRTLFKLCRKNRTQLIASTHSYEFLQSIASIMDEDLEKDVALLRLDKRSITEQPSVTMVPGVNYKAAIESGFEVR
jgi:hypothetical protein